MFNKFTNKTFDNRISIITIEFKDGFYELCELATPISRHSTLEEAEWLKSELESGSDNEPMVAAA